MKYKKMMPDVAANIKKCREIRNYTQDYVARELDISTTAYRNIENGKTSITLDYIYAIAEILSVNINALLYYNEQAVLSVYNGEVNDDLKNGPGILPSIDFRNMISMLNATHEKIMTVVDKNSRLRTDVNTVVLSVNRLIRELAKSQKKEFNRHL